MSPTPVNLLLQFLSIDSTVLIICMKGEFGTIVNVRQFPIISAQCKDPASSSILPLPQNINWDIVLKNLSNHVGACQEYKPIHKSLYCIMNHFLGCRKDLWQISFRFSIINESHKDMRLRGQEWEIFLYTNFPSMCSIESDISCY